MRIDLVCWLLLICIGLTGCMPVTAPVTATASIPAPTATPATSLPATPIARLQVEVMVTASTTELRVGETFTVTVTTRVLNPQECQYPLYEVSLVPDQATPDLVQFDTPGKLGPPGPNPASFTLTARAPGTLRLHAVTYGEQNCGNGWQWTYGNGSSLALTIGHGSYEPSISGGLAQFPTDGLEGRRPDALM